MKLLELLVADSVDSWRSAGFTVSDKDIVEIGDISIRLNGWTGAGTSRGGRSTKGIVGWAFDGLSQEGDIDGIPTKKADSGTKIHASAHPNGVTVMDHVVIRTPDWKRTETAFRKVIAADAGSHDLSQTWMEGWP